MEVQLTLSFLQLRAMTTRYDFGRLIVVFATELCNIMIRYPCVCVCVCVCVRERETERERTSSSSSYQGLGSVRALQALQQRVFKMWAQSAPWLFIYLNNN